MRFNDGGGFFYFTQGLGSVGEMEFSVYIVGLRGLLCDLGDEGWAVIGLNGHREAKSRNDLCEEDANNLRGFF